MSDYVIIGGELYNTNDLKHYGVKGMKWGVRKADYKAMNKAQRKETRRAWRNTYEGKLNKYAGIGALIAGPIGAPIGAGIAHMKYKDIMPDTLKKGKDTIEKHKSEPVKTGSKRVADIKSRVTGKKEDGKPAFLMTGDEHERFYADYEKRKNALSQQRKNAKDAAAKQRITKQMDQLENDFLSVVEQDFWYSDD